MTDFHAHVLPGIDDGSSSVEESVALLEMLCVQGVSRVCATPHFNALYDEPDRFIKRRDEAFLRLEEAAAEKEIPQIILGAEVAYFPGICNMQSIERLCLAGTRYLLLEMPCEPWSDYTVNELVKLAVSKDVVPVLAHVERYLSYQKANALERLRDVGVLMQVNASFFINRKTRRRALELLKRGEVHFLGSDCHDLVLRPPRYAEAVKVIEDKFGNKYDFNKL